MRVADYIVARLYEESVKHIFMVTGRGALFLTDAVAGHKGMEFICTHHEQAASYAAMAYAQANQKLGACMVSTGCASTNAITAALCAWQDDVPCVFISGQNKVNETVRFTKLPIRTYGQQEADIIRLVEPITKYAVMIEKAEDIVYELENAIHLAQTGRKGPVWIDVPLDIQNARIEPLQLRRYAKSGNPKKQASPADLAYVAEALEGAERPVVLIGSGVRSSNSLKELRAFIEEHELPLVYSNSAVDVIESAHPLSIGCVGAMAANRAANFAVQNADLVLVLGHRLTTLTMGEKFENFARVAKIIAVDVDEYEHQKFPGKVNQVILSDLNLFFKDLIKQKIRKTNPDWVEKCRQWKDKFPKCEERYKNSELVDIYELADVLGDSLADEAILVTDSGLEELLIPSTIALKKGQRCLHPPAQGAMGYALPAAIGAYCATGKQVVAVIGDGSVMMNIQELQTIKHNHLPIKVLIVNNNCYAVIRKRQQDLFRSRTIGTDVENGVSCPEFERIAYGFDLPYKKISSTVDLKNSLKNILGLAGATICEVMAKHDQCYIHSSYRKNANGRLVQPPIEDQSPFLSRDVFLSEMIIKPIDL